MMSYKSQHGNMAIKWWCRNESQCCFDLATHLILIGGDWNITFIFPYIEKYWEWSSIYWEILGNIGNVIIPIDWLIFLRGVGIPPTTVYYRILYVYGIPKAINRWTLDVNKQRSKITKRSHAWLLVWVVHYPVYCWIPNTLFQYWNNLFWKSIWVICWSSMLGEWIDSHSQKSIASIPGSFVMRVSAHATNRLCTVIRCGG